MTKDIAEISNKDLLIEFINRTQATCQTPGCNCVPFKVEARKKFLEHVIDQDDPVEIQRIMNYLIDHIFGRSH